MSLRALIFLPSSINIEGTCILRRLFFQRLMVRGRFRELARRAKPALGVSRRSHVRESYVIIGGMSPAVGRRIGPYEVISRLDDGGMGEVFRARDPRLDTYRARELRQSFPACGEGEWDRVPLPAWRRRRG
jgi:hypothetical protein